MCKDSFWVSGNVAVVSRILVLDSSLQIIMFFFSTHEILACTLTERYNRDTQWLQHMVVKKIDVILIYHTTFIRCWLAPSRYIITPKVICRIVRKVSVIPFHYPLKVILFCSYVKPIKQVTNQNENTGAFSKGKKYRI